MPSLRLQNEQIVPTVPQHQPLVAPRDASCWRMLPRMVPRAPFTFLGFNRILDLLLQPPSKEPERCPLLWGSIGYLIFNEPMTDRMKHTARWHSGPEPARDRKFEIFLSTKNSRDKKAKYAEYILLNTRQPLPCLHLTVTVLLHLPNESCTLPPT